MGEQSWPLPCEAVGGGWQLEAAEEFLIPVPQLCWRVGMFVGGEQGMGSR